MKTLRERDMWQSKVLADDTLSSGSKCTLVRISLHHNFKTGQCNPSYAVLAAGTGVKLAAIPKQLNQGIERGYLRRISTQGRHSNSYEMLFPTDAARSGLTADSGIGSTADSRIGIENVNPIPPSDPTNSFRANEPPTSIRANTESSLNKETNNEGRYIPPSKSLVLFEKEETTGDEFFRAFYHAYPRKKAKGAAEAALKQVLKKKITTESVIMAGVARLAVHWAMRPKSDLRFCPYPAKWLHDQGWADEIEEPPNTAREISYDAIAGFNRRPQ